MIGILNYGVGNIRAIVNCYQSLNYPVKVIQNRSEMKGVTHFIMPGVGSFDQAKRLFVNSEFYLDVENYVFDKKFPILAICVGMQLLFSKSEEGLLPGLGWIDGEILSLNKGLNNKFTPVPHMGWNSIKLESNEESLFKGLQGNEDFYFLHSYYAKCASESNIIARTDYQIMFTSAVRKENIIGVQFHPEKSHGWGKKILENFYLN